MTPTSPRSTRSMRPATQEKIAMRAKETTLDALMAKMKIELRQSEVDTKSDPEELGYIGWGPRSGPTPPAAPRRTPPLRLYRTGQGQRRIRLEKPRSRRRRTRPQLPRRTPRRRQCRRPRRLASGRRRHLYRGPPARPAPRHPARISRPRHQPRRRRRPQRRAIGCFVTGIGI